MHAGMFKKLFKGDQHAQAQQRHDVDVSPSTMSKTLDAVQQLGDVSGFYNCF